MGFGYIIAGFILMANPIIHVVDLLPDFIGFLLLCRGLNKLAYMNSSLSEARDLFRKLGFVELARAACIVFIPYTSDSALMLFAFVFGVVELIWFIPGLNYFYEGLYHIGMKYEGESVFAKIQKKRNGAVRVIERGTALKRFTYSFYILRIICTLFPELTALQMYDYLGTVTAFSVDYRRYKPFLYVLLGLAVIITGICWMVKLCRYFGGIRKDKQFNENLNRYFETEVAVKTHIFIGRNMKNTLYLYVGAVVLSLCLYIEGINVILGLFSATLLAAAAIQLGKYMKLAYAVLPLCAIRGVLSLVNMVLQKIYYVDNLYDEQAIQYHVVEAYEQYYRMGTLMVIENIAAILAFGLFAVAFLKTVKKHLAETGNQNDSVQYSKINRDIETYNAIGSKVLLNLILMLINFILAASYLFIMVNLNAIVAINAAVTLIWILQTLSMVSTTNDLLYTPLTEDAV